MIDPTCRRIGYITIPASARVDAFCVLTGRVDVGEHVHVATGCRLIGSSGRIVLGRGSFVSMGSTLLTASDDYTSPTLIGPTIPDRFRQVKAGDVIFKPYAGVGAHAIVMPGVTLGYGSRVGANSLVTRDIPAGEIWAGTPARKVGEIDLEELRLLAAEWEATQR